MSRIVAGAVLLLVVGPASAQTVGTTCGEGLGCTAAYSDAIQRCIAGGGNSFKILGPCSERQAAGTATGLMRQCLTCVSEPDRRPADRPAAAPAPAAASASSCRLDAQELQALLQQCTNPAGCSLQVVGADARELTLSPEDAAARVRQMNQIADAEENVATLEDQVSSAQEAIRRLGFASRASEFEQQTAETAAAQSELADTLTKETVGRVVDKFVEVASMAAQPAAPLSRDAAAASIQRLRAALRSSPIGSWSGSNDVAREISTLIAGGAGSPEGLKETADLLKTAIDGALPAGERATAAAPEELLETVYETLKRLVPPGAARAGFDNALAAGRVAIQAWYAAAVAGVAVQRVDELTARSEADLESLKRLSSLLKHRVDGLKDARRALAALPSCDPMRIARARLVSPTAEPTRTAAQPPAAKGGGSGGKPKSHTGLIVGATLLGATALGVGYAINYCSTHPEEPMCGGNGGSSSGSGGKCSNRSCIPSVFSSTCDCAGSAYGGSCGTKGPLQIGQSCYTQAVCREGAVCVNGTCKATCP